MSQERRERQNEKLGIKTSSRNWGRIAIYAALIVAAFGLAYYLNNRSRHKNDAFARCLTERGVKMYGAWWYVPYVECGIKGETHGQSQVCKDENVKHYPTWQFPPTGERVERIFSLQELSDRTGCALP
jgi:hypothetical protein